MNTGKWNRYHAHLDKEVEKTLEIAKWVKNLTCIQEVAGSNPADEQIFFFENNTFAYIYFKFNFDNTATWHYKHALKQAQLNARFLVTQIC